MSMMAGSFVAMVNPAGAGGSTVRDAQEINYDGRVILATGSPYECGESDEAPRKSAIEVQQFESGSSKPDELAAFRSRTALAAVSDDARWAVTCRGELRDLDRGTTTLVLPVDYDVVPNAELERAAFSPDATRLAFSFGGTVYVYDIASDALEESFTTPSESYQNRGTIYGEIGDVDWLDATNLVVWHFSGTMPSSINCDAGGECRLPAANTYSIVAPAGDRIASAAGSEAIDEVRGDTLLLSSEEWVDVSELRTGTATPRELPSRSLRCISPDGTQAVRQGTPWRLVELRTGDETPLEAVVKLRKPFDAALRPPLPCVWSPDGQYVAALSEVPATTSSSSYNKLFLVPATPGETGEVAYKVSPANFNHLGWTIP